MSISSAYKLDFRLKGGPGGGKARGPSFILAAAALKASTLLCLALTIILAALNSWAAPESERVERKTIETNDINVNSRGKNTREPSQESSLENSYEGEEEKKRKPKLTTKKKKGLSREPQVKMPEAAALDAQAAQSILIKRGDKPFNGEIRLIELFLGPAEIKIPKDCGSTSAPDYLADLAVETLKKVDQLWSLSDKKSDLSRFNAAQKGQWVSMDPLTMAAILEASAWHKRTAGLYEPTIGAIAKIFPIERMRLKKWPGPEAISQARNLVGLDNVEIDQTGGKLSKKINGLSLDFGTIAKGLAADLVAEILTGQGVKNAFINVGGVARVLGQDSGQNPTEPWLSALKDPLGGEKRYELNLTDKAIASRGHRNNFFEYEGRKYSFSFDPRTGLPLEDLVRMVTVVYPDSAASASAIAEAMNVMGPYQAANVLKERGREVFPDGLEVVFTINEADELKTIHLSLQASGALTVKKS
jgi:thiamine biosynthesis lipoprotein